MQGSRKTIKGTPDSYYRTLEGSYIYIETTTQSYDLVNKIKNDIDSCLNIKLSKIPFSSQSKIIICIRVRLSLNHDNIINEYAKSRNINIEILSFDKWIYILEYLYPFLANKYLNIQIDKGSLIPANFFISQYANKSNAFATPLDNLYIKSQTNNLNNAITSLAQNNLIIISGVPGSGKTRLALEMTKEFETNNNYQTFVLKDSFGDIGLQINQLIQINQKIIIIVDDANRQEENTRKLLNNFRYYPDTVKIILTVRQYALQDIVQLINCYEYKNIYLENSEDDIIISIIDSFNINNKRIKDKILSLSEGNPRLAIMCCKIAEKKGIHFLFDSVASVYDNYFTNFADSEILNNNNYLKVLGLLGFFNSLSIKKANINNLLNIFDIDYSEFESTIYDLQKKEFVEIQFEIVKISDQIFSTYCFQIVFFDKKLLSFEILLKNYFFKKTARFADCFLACYSAFGSERTCSQIRNIIVSFLNDINDDNCIFIFLEVFGYVCINKTLNYLDTKIEEMSQEKVIHINSNYNPNDFSVKKDPILHLLYNFFHLPNNYLIDAIDLSIDYINKQPSRFAEWSFYIFESIVIRTDDIYINLYRQYKFIDKVEFLLNNKIPDCISLEACTTICCALIKYESDYNESRNNKFYFVQQGFPLNKCGKELRIKIWKCIDKIFSINCQKGYFILEKILHYSCFHNLDVMLFDEPYLINILIKRLDNDNIKNSFLVFDFIKKYKHTLNIFNEEQWIPVINKFQSHDFIKVNLLSWSWLDDEYMSGSNCDHKDFTIKKINQLEKSFSFKVIDDYNEFNRLFLLAKNCIPENELLESLDNIISINLNSNIKFGLLLLSKYISLYSKTTMYKTMRTIAISSAKSDIYWHIVFNYENQSLNYNNCLCFLAFLNRETINDSYKNNLINILSKCKGQQILLSNYENYNCYDEMISALIENKAYNKLQSVPYTKLKYNIGEKLYFLQCKTTGKLSFDYDSTVLEYLYKNDPNIILRYLKEFCNDNNNELQEDFSFIWKNNNNYDIKIECCNFLLNRNLYNNSFIVLFNKSNNEEKNNGIVFLKNFMINNHNSLSVTAIIHTVNNLFPYYLKDFIKIYLDFNPSASDFMDVEWIPSINTIIGDQSFSEIEVNRWINIRNIVEGCKTMQKRKILRKISETIDSYSDSIIKEKAHIFSRN